MRPLNTSIANTMFNKKTTDIMVLGAGPVGLTAAHALTDRDMDYVLIDREQRTNTHSYALALHPETLALLDNLGIVEPVLDKAIQLQRVAIYEADQQKSLVDYSQLPVKYPFLAVIGQNELENILVQTLAQKKRKPLWNHRARIIEERDTCLNVTVDRLMEGMTGYAVAYIDMQVDKIFEYSANYIIGADGHDSNARRSAGIEFPEYSPSEDYAVFEFKTDAMLPREMRIIIDDEQTHIFWPLPEGRCRFSFQVSNSADADSIDKDHRQYSRGRTDLPELDRKHLKELLHQHAPWFRGSVEQINWRMMVHFEHRLAANFGKGRIWLAGDSAHMTHPGGIMSMNAGMLEAADLVEHLSTDTSDEVRQFRLAAYNADCLGEWKRRLDLDHHIVASDATASWLLSHHDSVLGNLPASGETLKAVLKQLHMTEAA